MILLILPNQLFADHPGFQLDSVKDVVLLEDTLFFNDARYPTAFCKQKLWLHRATMKRCQSDWEADGRSVTYLDYRTDTTTIDQQLRRGFTKKQLAGKTLAVADPVDFVLEKRLLAAADQLGMKLKWLPNPGFLNSRDENQSYRAGKKRWFMADFYKWQRKRLDILIDDGEPSGGQWSYDEDNRKKVPKKELSSIPELALPERDAIDHEAAAHVQDCFSEHPGSIEQLYYPTSHASAETWLEAFLEHRLSRFGDYEDAIVEGQNWLWHSVLTPSLNIGLLTPKQVIETTLAYAEKHNIPLNSLEGFVRQIIGWREFMRATYEDLGVDMRTTNHWQHHRPIPDCFYNATTGIDPIDDTIRRLLDTGYCHHIERLMVLGGFMFLCEIDPDDIYRWFMELFVDSYDWVMVPNVYAMSQNADGGLITTKPYFSGSSYIRKMSHHKVGPWCAIWDGLYWRWIHNHTETLGKNPRWAMMCSMAKRMPDEKRQTHLGNAEAFLSSLS